jgi:hypothetical protein
MEWSWTFDALPFLAFLPRFAMSLHKIGTLNYHAFYRSKDLNDLTAFSAIFAGNNFHLVAFLNLHNIPHYLSFFSCVHHPYFLHSIRFDSPRSSLLKAIEANAVPEAST